MSKPVPEWVRLKEEIMEAAVETTRTLNSANNLHLAPVKTTNTTSRPTLKFLQSGCPSCYPTDNNVKALRACLCRTFPFDVVLE